MVEERARKSHRKVEERPRGGSRRSRKRGTEERRTEERVSEHRFNCVERRWSQVGWAIGKARVGRDRWSFVVEEMKSKRRKKVGKEDLKEREAAPCSRRSLRNVNGFEAAPHSPLVSLFFRSLLSPAHNQKHTSANPRPRDRSRCRPG